MGRFKNKRVKIKTITTNEKGDLLINGRPALKFRMKDGGKVLLPKPPDIADNPFGRTDDDSNADMRVRESEILDFLLSIYSLFELNSSPESIILFKTLVGSPSIFISQ